MFVRLFFANFDEIIRIPWFVVTTTKDMEDSDKFQLKMTLKRKSAELFSSFESTGELFEKIVVKVGSLPHRKFTKELSVCREQEQVSLSSLLWEIEYD